MTDFEKLGICIFATIMVLTNVWGFMMLNEKLSAIIIRLDKVVKWDARQGEGNQRSGML